MCSSNLEEDRMNTMRTSKRYIKYKKVSNRSHRAGIRSTEPTSGLGCKSTCSINAKCNEEIKLNTYLFASLIGPMLRIKYTKMSKYNKGLII